MPGRIDPNAIVGERRVGRRGEQKRRWDYENRADNCDCGARKNIRNKRCVSCDHRLRAAARYEREGKIAELFREGLLLKDIAAELNTTVNSIGSTIVGMRKAGWDLPKRPPGGRR